MNGVLWIACLLRATGAEPTSPTVAPPPSPTVAPPPSPTTAVVGSKATASSSARPPWVGLPPGLHGNDYRADVFVGPQLSRSQCERELPAAIEAEVRSYLSARLGPQAAAKVPFDYATLRPRIVGEVWEEQIAFKDGNYVCLHAQLTIDPKLRVEWEEIGRRALVHERSWNVAATYAAVVALLGVASLGLKVASRLAVEKPERGA